MGTKTLFSTTITILLLSIFYQLVLKDIIFIALGVGRSHQKISEFPYQCRRLHSPLLESCEDMVLDEDGRTLYAACSSFKSRRNWSPGGDKFDISTRDLKDHVSVLDIDHPGSDGLYGLRTLKITGNYGSSTGGKDIDVHGLEIEHISPSRLRFWMINHRPPVDEAGNPLDPKKVGANSTLEVFEYEKGNENLEWVKTVSSEAVYTPNNLVATGDGGVLVTNDHNSKTGPWRRLEIITGGGSVAYCTLSTSSCKIASSSSFTFANGIILLPSHPSSTSLDPTVLVAHSAKGHLTSHTYHRSNKTLSPGSKIPLNIPVDNLSIDTKGHVYIAAFPKVLALIEALDGKAKGEGKWVEIPSTLLRVRREDERGEWKVEKVLEDIEGVVLPGSTVAVHDVESGNLWMGGVASPFITVCEPLG